jgi:hypothetical protein
MFDYDQTLRALHEVIDANPDARNPKGGEACVYTDPDDPTRHCIVGQVLVHLSLPLPPPKAGSVRSCRQGSACQGDPGGVRRLFTENFTDDALDLLETVQLQADNQNIPKTWSDLYLPDEGVSP